MSLQKLILPDHYTSKLDILNTEIAIKLVKVLLNGNWPRLYT